MTATAALTTDLQRQVLLLEDDLRARLAADPVRKGGWKQEHQRATDKDRTAANWVSWRDDRITQAAVAWVLTTVFIRFCEDNALLRPVWITGPGARRQEALDSQLAFFRQHPDDTDREWLLDAVNYLSRLPATRALVESHSALHLVSPSGDAVTGLLEFWRRRDDDGALVHDLTDPSLSTRFLGDLYQELSQHAKDTYALLQTPVFVEEFILDRTMEPALADRPLEGFSLIDPACGSGHFLLGAFARLLDRWHRHSPDMETQARVQTALDAIHGVDLNPFAVAIARFRLTLAALQASGLRSLEQAPAFTFHLAVGDSLIHGPDRDTLPGMAARSAFMPFTYATEDSALLLSILEEGRYDVVVGNPPYISARDKALNQIYRSKYADVCKGKYALTVPFMKLMFSLAKSVECPGWVGQITSNSFMKREFGTRLIEDFLTHIDLRLVADTSGAYIPGHGTPTIIIVGRNQPPVASSVRAVLGIRGEIGRPDDPAKGIVWSAITEYVDDPGADNGWITVTDLDRRHLAQHPWSLQGGEAIKLLATLEGQVSRRISDRSYRIGVFGIMGSDDAMMSNEGEVRRHHLESSAIRNLVVGDQVRDFVVTDTIPCWFPYDESHNLQNLDLYTNWSRRLWPLKAELNNRSTFSGGTYLSDGRPYYEWHQLPRDIGAHPWTIIFAFVATHNHFVLDRGGKVFNRSAPMIKLPEPAIEDEYLALLGILNSSTACFWLKQNSHDKGNRGGERSTARYAWENFYEFTGSTLEEYPLCGVLPLNRGRILDLLATKLSSSSPLSVCAEGVPSAVSLTAARSTFEHTRAQMVAVQEELDWEVYKLYGLIDENMTYQTEDLPELLLGERSFEIAMARQADQDEGVTAWFGRHGSKMITDVPASWPDSYRKLVERRLELIENNPFVRLLEQPEYKRRWAQEPWEKRQERALHEWLLDRLEGRGFWFDSQGRPWPRSIAQLADEVGRDADLTSVLALWEGRPDVPVTQSLTKLLADEAVPFLAAYRYKDSGLRKWDAWEQTWALQRREDGGERVGQIPVPPKYAPVDFRKASYWHARGKLDVPKERFILYPDAGRETDPTPLLGWAGWDHAQQALALSVIITDRENEGWPADRLVPLVAGLAELQPWVEQWHSDIDQRYGVSMATFCREQLTARAIQVGKTMAELAAWRPAAPARGRRSRS
jgi:Domain of unknown function (DUF7008)/Eco57I restriction-modification methylase